MNISRSSVFTFNIIDYGDESTPSPETGYSKNMWIQWPFGTPCDLKTIISETRITSNHSEINYGKV